MSTPRVRVTAKPPLKPLVKPLIAAPPTVAVGPVPIPVPATPVPVQVSQRERQHLQALAKEREEKLPRFAVRGLGFYILSTKDILASSVVNVDSPEFSGVKSVNDPQMGVTEENMVCSTCCQDNLQCPGHYGRIELQVPIILSQYQRYVLQVLSCVCNSCGGLLLTAEQIKQKGLDQASFHRRLELLEKECVGLPCLRKQEAGVTPCRINPTYIPKVSKETGQICYTYEEKPTQDTKFLVRTVEEVEAIFMAISPQDVTLMGFLNDAHPLNFITRMLPVIPPRNRTPAVIDGVLRHHHLTLMYSSIVRANNLLKTPLSESARDRAVKNLISQIEHFISNSDGKQKVGKQEVSGLKERVQGKKAIVRQAMMGKRVNYTARTVINPDPTLKFGQVRVPKIMAPYLTVEEYVNVYNYKEIQRLLREDRITYVVPSRGKQKGTRISITEKVKTALLYSESDRLTIGDKVERHLQNGDYVIFNRQPTLHKQSMMGYEVVLGDQLTIGMHLSAVKGHNADFDGDESVLHSTQLIGARAEVSQLMNIKQCIMSAQTNSPMSGAVLDTINGAYLLTSDKMYKTRKVGRERNVETGASAEIPLEDVDKPAPEGFYRYVADEPVYGADGKPELTDLLVSPSVYGDCLSLLTAQEQLPTLNDRLKKHNIPPYSGRALFSALLPADLYYKRSKKLNDKQENTVLIMNGVLVSGIITKTHIGATGNSLIQTMWKDYGMERTAQFLTDITYVMDRWLLSRGFTVGLQDCYPMDDTHKKLIRTEVETMKLDVEALGGKLDDTLEEEQREGKIRSRVDTVKNVGYKMSTEKLAPDNALNVMAVAESKGTTFNIAQITGMIGQQFFRGKRLGTQLEEGKRSLPYFEGDSLEAQGFIDQSFLDGLTPAQFYQLNMAGREGLMDTALMTAETGYIQRRMMESLRDLVVAYDGSVRNAAGQIIQFVYGYDGFDAQELQAVSSDTGGFASFIDVVSAADKINVKYGFAPQH